MLECVSLQSLGTFLSTLSSGFQVTSILPFAFHAFVTGFFVETLYQTSLAMGSMYLEVQACTPIASKTSVHSVNIARESFGGSGYQHAGFNGQYRAGTSDVAILLL